MPFRATAIAIAFGSLFLSNSSTFAAQVSCQSAIPETANEIATYFENGGYQTLTTAIGTKIRSLENVLDDVQSNRVQLDPICTELLSKLVSLGFDVAESAAAEKLQSNDPLLTLEALRSLQGISAQLHEIGSATSSLAPAQAGSIKRLNDAVSRVMVEVQKRHPDNVIEPFTNQQASAFRGATIYRFAGFDLSGLAIQEFWLDGGKLKHNAQFYAHSNIDVPELGVGMLSVSETPKSIFLALRDKVAKVEGLAFSAAPGGIYQLSFEGLSDPLRFRFVEGTNAEQASSGLYELLSMLSKHGKRQRLAVVEDLTQITPGPNMNTRMEASSTASKVNIPGSDIIKKSACYYLPMERAIKTSAFLYRSQSEDAEKIRALLAYEPVTVLDVVASTNFKAETALIEGAILSWAKVEFVSDKSTRSLDVGWFPLTRVARNQTSGSLELKNRLSPTACK